MHALLLLRVIIDVIIIIINTILDKMQLLTMAMKKWSFPIY